MELPRQVSRIPGMFQVEEKKHRHFNSHSYLISEQLKEQVNLSKVLCYVNNKDGNYKSF